jgi:streptomycin 6-kinase
LRLPASLDWLRGSEEGRAWLAQLPKLADECAEAWSLELGEPFPYAFASLALPAVDADGADVVLKVAFPDRESAHEGDALAAWGGNGAVRLLDRDRERHALLIERCRPGTSLEDVDPEAALDVVIGLLPRLWIAADEPFRPLADEAAWWLSYLPDRWEAAGRRFERRLVDAAVNALEELAASQGEQVLLHQDLHGGNVLADGRAWLAIDPKPLAGERDFDVASLLRDRRPELAADPAPERRVRRRLDRLAGDLALDRERARRWGVIHALAWGVAEDAVFPEIVACAGWLARA